MTRRMKDSGVEWIGGIPKSWEVVKLKHIGNFTASGIDKLIKKDELKVKIVNYVDVFNSKTKLLNNDNYMEVTTTEEKKDRHNLIKGDVLFTPSSETVDEIGYSAIIDENLINTSYSYHLLRFRFNDDIVHGYKRFMFNNEALLNQFASRARGTTRKTLNRIDFKESIIPIPKKDKQQSIANFLDKKTLEIDKIISKTKEVIKEYKKYKQSLITEVVTGGLNKDVAMKDSGIEWIGKIPEHWEITKLARLCYKIGDVDHKMPEAKKEGIPYVSPTNFYGINEIDFKNAKQITQESYREISKKIKPEKGDIIFARYATIGTIRLVNTNKEFLVSYSCAIIKPDIEKLNSKYLYYYLKSHTVEEEAKRFINLNTQSNIGIDSIERFRIATIPIKEQKQIAEYLDKKCKEIDNIIQTKEKLLVEMESYKKSLIYETVTGKREVN